MPVAFNKFNTLEGDLGLKVHNFNTDTFKAALTNALPLASNTVFANITEIAAGNGYAAGGPAVTVTSFAQVAGVGKFALTVDPVITASGGNIGPFQYVVLYNATQTVPLKPLVGWADNGSPVTLNPGDTFTLGFDTVNGILTVT